MKHDFKVGDRVKFVMSNQTDIPLGSTGTVTKINEIYLHILWDDERLSLYSFGYYYWRFEVISDNSPVREVIKREVVDGQYGVVFVKNVLDKNKIGIMIDKLNTGITLKKLKAAINTLQKIAEVMEENAGHIDEEI